MKKILTMITLILLTFALLISICGAFAETTPAEAFPDTTSGEPFTWAYLASIAGTAAFALLFVQFFKVPLDKVWKIPTRVFVYIICLATMLIATAFTSGLTVQTAILSAVNAMVAALSAMGAYEITFAKISK